MNVRAAWNSLIRGDLFLLGERRRPSVPLKAPVMGVLGWFATKQGTVIGPVEPTTVELDGLPDGRVVIRLAFECYYPDGPKVLLTDATFHIGEVVRRHPVDQDWLHAGETTELTYTMTGTFDS